MELWLLGAGAIVLIAITLWIVWPSSTADTVGTTTVPIEEDRPMTQYTSPTADMASGGVATAEPECLAVDEWKRERLIGVGADFIVPNFLDGSTLFQTLFPAEKPSPISR